MTPPIANVVPVEIVPAAEVEAIVAAADDEFAALERQAAEALALAEREEERARMLQVDPAGTPRALLSVKRFVDDWRAEAERDAERMVGAAREGARVRLDEAHAEAARIRQTRPRVHAQLTPPSVVERDEPEVVLSGAAAPPTSTFVAFAPQPEADEVAPSAVTPEPVPPEPVVVPLAEEAGSEVAAPAAEASKVDAEPASVVDPADAPVSVDPPAAETPPSSELSLAAIDDDRPAFDGSAEGGFWAVSSEPEKKRRGLFGRIPLSAVLEVIAVLLILVFILLRLS